MKNGWFLFIPLVIIVTLISTGCGVSGSQYDAVSIELNLAKQERQELKTQLQAAQSEAAVAKADLTRAQAGLGTAQGQLQAAQAERQATQTQLQAVQSQLTATKTDLQSAQTMVQSLQNDLNAARGVPARALSYAEFMDILMYEFWMASGVTPSLTFSNAGEWLAALRNRANSIGDATLIGFVNELSKGPVDKNRIYSMDYYCVSKIKASLK